MTIRDWEQFLEWEKKTPPRFTPDRSHKDSDYNQEHSIVEATAEETKEILNGDG